MLGDRIARLEGGIVCPTDETGGTGVLAADGSFCDLSRTLTTARRGPPAPRMPVPDALARRPGTHVYAGWLRPHFGHFLFESTSRLWALDAVEGGVDSILFTPFKRGGLRQAWRRYEAFLRLLAGNVRIAFLREPTQIEDLVVPEPGFSYGAAAKGSAAYKRFMRGRVAAGVAPNGPERIYISRAALPDQRGGVFGEELIERLMTANGYHVYYPEQHDIPAQLATYRAARKVVALDGSALHMAAYALPDGAEVAMIRRRSSGPLDAITMHLSAFADARVQEVSVLRDDWVADDHGRVDYRSIGELDLAALEDRLAASGFIARGIGLAPLEPAEIARRIEAMRRGPMRPWAAARAT